MRGVLDGEMGVEGGVVGGGGGGVCGVCGCWMKTDGACGKARVRASRVGMPLR